MTVCVVTYLPSPYQVELFNAIAAAGDVNLQVVYLRRKIRSHPWTADRLEHDHVFIDSGLVSTQQAWRWCRDASVTVFNYYTHAFALASLYARHLSGRPWTFWGERPGYLNLGKLGALGRRLLLTPLGRGPAPIWGVGKLGIQKYQQDWGMVKAYLNFPYYSDLDRFKVTRDLKKNDSITVLFSGVLSHRKGILDLAVAFRNAALKHPQLQLLIVGSGPLEGTVKQLLEPVADRVTWSGFQEWDKLPDLYAQADVFCLPTRYDGWAMVIPEALAVGLPVLSTTSAGAAMELIEEGVNGWLLPSNEAHVLEEALCALTKQSRTTLAAMSKAARQSIASYGLETGARRFSEAVAQTLTLFKCSHRLIETRTALQASTRLLIAGTYEPDRLTSMKRYVRLVEIAAQHCFTHVSVIQPPVILGALPFLPDTLKKILAYTDKYLLFPLLLRWKARASDPNEIPLIHVTDQGMGLILPWLIGIPVLVTCHDLIAVRDSLGEFEETHDQTRRNYIQHLIRPSLALQSTMVCVSKKTMTDCRRLLGGNHRFLVIMNPLDPEFAATESSDNLPHFPDAFFLHVGNSMWYKNRQAVLRIYAAIQAMQTTPPELVMMGEPPTPQELRLAKALAIEGHIHWIPRAPDAWIKQGYRQAVALIFPSLEEGFGWPVLEAMSQGCPVFTSNFAPLTEVGGDAVEYIDPHDPEGAARLISQKIYLGETWRSHQSGKGRERAGLFTTTSFAVSMQEAYRQAIIYHECPGET
ncbi:hypothetical protein BH11VER1_BH11VER1_10700 [soil metagenome]